MAKNGIKAAAALLARTTQFTTAVDVAASAWRDPGSLLTASSQLTVPPSPADLAITAPVRGSSAVFV